MEKKSNKIKDFFHTITLPPIQWWDWVLFVLLSAFCFFSYEMRDLYHTAGCSYGFLDGHFFDFYDYLAASGIGEDGSIGLHASYLPSIYIIFAIWNIPMKLFHIVPSATAQLGFASIMWAKLLPCLVFIGSGIVFYKICRELGMEQKKSKIAMYAFLTVPAALYVQFIMGQYESFTMLFILLGFYSWLKKKDVWFVFWFAIAVTFKYTALVFFLPLVLLREKNIWKILIMLVGALLPTAFWFLIYHGSPMFNAYVFGIGGSGDAPTGYLFYSGYFTGYELSVNKYMVYLTVLGFAGVCAYAYFKDSMEKYDESRWAIFLCCLAYASVFCFSKWHPQWLLLVIPFWVISAFLHKNTKIFLILDFMFMVIMIIMNTCLYPGTLDEVMINNGWFKFLFDGTINYTTNLVDILGKLDPSLCLSILTALIGIFAIFKHPKYMAADADQSVDNCMGWIRARYIVGLLFFIIPSLICVKNALNPPAMMYQESIYEYIAVFDKEDSICQSFTAQGDKISKIKFPITLGEKENDGTLQVQIRDDSQKVIYEDTINLSNKYDGEKMLLSPGVSVENGKEYDVLFTLDAGETPEMKFGVVLSSSVPGYENAILGNKEQKYHMVLSIYE